jgi:E3 ubiquitin-protein ligase TRIP12
MGAIGGMRGGGSGLPPALSSEEQATMLEALQSGDESATYSALADLTPALAVGTEDTLQGFDCNEFARVLTALMSTMVHNAEILLLACRAVCHILEALPRSSRLFLRHGIVAPLCEQLRSIQFIDVAEQCLLALHKLASHHASRQALLAADALGAVLGFVDFFAISAQRTALRTAVSLCSTVAAGDAAHVLPSFPTLVQMLSAPDASVAGSAVDCVTSVILQLRTASALAPFVDAAPDLVAGLVRLMSTAQDDASVTRIAASVRQRVPTALAALAEALPRKCAVAMIDAGLPTLLHAALLGDASFVPNTPLSAASSVGIGSNSGSIFVASSPQAASPMSLAAMGSPATPSVLGAVRRSADNVLQLILLADALLPTLPGDLAAFFDDAAGGPAASAAATRVLALDNESRGDQDEEGDGDGDGDGDEERDILDDVAAVAFGGSGDASRTLVSPPPQARDLSAAHAGDERVQLFAERRDLVLAVGSVLLSAAIDTYNGNADARVRETAMRFVVKLVWYADEAQLDTLICNLAFSSFVASLLASRRSSVCGAAVALAGIGMAKLPSILPTHYRREGVMSELHALSERADDSDVRWRAVAAAARAMLDKADFADSALNQSGGSEALQALSVALAALGSASTASEARAALRDVACALLLDARLSVHEFQQSHVVAALLSFVEGSCAGDGPVQRATMLGASLCARNAADETAGTALLRLLQQLLSKHADAFRVRRSGDIVGGPAASLAMLMKPLRIQLRPARGDGERPTLSVRCMVEPLASCRTIAEFVAARVDQNGDLRSSTDGSTASAPRSAVAGAAASQQPGGGVVVHEFDVPPAAPVSASALAAAAAAAAAANTDGLRQSAGSVVRPTRVDLQLNGRRLDPGATIMHAVVSAAAASDADSASEVELALLVPVWRTLHDVKYAVRGGGGGGDDMQSASSGAASDDDVPRGLLLRSSATFVSAPSDSGELDDFAVLASALSSRCTLPGAPADFTAALRLVTMLRAMHEHAELCTAEGEPVEQRVCASALEFQNARLDATMAQQLGEPLLLAAGALPHWCRPLVSAPARLVSLATRALYFRATALGAGRSLSALEQRVGGGADGAGAAVARLERCKIRVRRDAILECAEAALAGECGTTRALLEVEFFDEQGTGVGPTLEFFTLASRQLWSAASWAAPAMWRADSSGAPLQPLFPRSYAAGALPARVEQMFAFCGRLMARALLDERRVDLPLALPLVARLAGTSRRYSRAAALRIVDPALAIWLDRLERCARVDGDGAFDGAPIGELGLDMTWNGAPLAPGGADVPVTRANAGAFVAAVRDAVVGAGVSAQIDALLRGFHSVLDEPLDLFAPAELLELLCGRDEPWSLESLRAVVRVEGFGGGADHASVSHLLHTLADFDADERRAFLMFSTGSPRLPVGGLSTMRLTVVRKDVPPGAEDAVLPSISVCFGRLNFPPYSSVAVCRRQLAFAMANAKAFTFS